MSGIISAILLVYSNIKSKLSAETRERDKSLIRYRYIMLDYADSSAREGNVLGLSSFLTVLHEHRTVSAAVFVTDMIPFVLSFTQN